MYRDIRNYENVTKMNIQGVGMYDIPARNTITISIKVRMVRITTVQA